MLASATSSSTRACGWPPTKSSLGLSAWVCSVSSPTASFATSSSALPTSTGRSSKPPSPLSTLQWEGQGGKVGVEFLIGIAVRDAPRRACLITHDLSIDENYSIQHPHSVLLCTLDKQSE